MFKHSLNTVWFKLNRTMHFFVYLFLTYLMLYVVLGWSSLESHHCNQSSKGVFLCTALCWICCWISCGNMNIQCHCGACFCSRSWISNSLFVTASDALFYIIYRLVVVVVLVVLVECTLTWWLPCLQCILILHICTPFSC